MELTPASAISLPLLVKPAMLGRAVEDCTGRKAFAARQMNAAVGATNHVFRSPAAALACPGPRPLALVRLDEPVRDDKHQYQQEVLQ
jgi:hypothetical protein